MDLIKLRILFMGTSPFAVTILESLLQNNYNIIGVYTQGDKKVGRKKEIKKSAVKIFTEERNIPVFSPERFDEEEIEKIKNLQPDLIIVVAYGKILPKKILEIPGFSSLNIHASLLPKFRGPSPIQNALLEGEKETGSTIMLMDEGIDTGDILTQDSLPIGKDEKYSELSSRLADLSANLLLKTLPLWVEKKIEAKPQDNLQATLCQLIERQDGKINWNETVEEIYNRYRAFESWPGIFSFWETQGRNLRLKLKKISLSPVQTTEGGTHQLGEVYQSGETIYVQTSSGSIVLEEVQLEGKNIMTIKDFINGNASFIGSLLK